MDTFKKLLNAVIVVPFTAGHTSKILDSTSLIRPHDGNISGLILLSSLFVLCFVGIFGTATLDEPLNDDELNRIFVLKFQYLSVVSIISSIIYIGLWIGKRSHYIILQKLGYTENSDTLKRTFLWIFTVCTCFFSIFQNISFVNCAFENYEELEQAGCTNGTENFRSFVKITLISYECTKIIFYLIQTVFIHTFSCYRFNNSWKYKYCLLLVVLTNVSYWTNLFTNIFMDFNMDMQITKIFCPVANGTNTLNTVHTCYSKKLVEIIEPYFRPIELEYFLLSMIFIADYWPSIFRDGYVNIDNMESEQRSLTFSSHYNTQYKLKCNSFLRTSRCLILGMIVAIPNYVFSYLSGKEDISYIHLQNSTSSGFEIADFTYDISLEIIQTIILFYCFHLFSLTAYLIPKDKIPTMNFHHKLLIVSFLGTVGYFSLEIMACMLLHYKNQEANLLMSKRSVMLFQLYLQLVCILQFNNYKTKKNVVLSSKRYVFLIIAAINLILWIDDSIFEVMSYDKKIIEVVYDTTAERFISHFLFPFFVFFRFKSFIAFYGIFKQMPSELLENEYLEI